MKVLDIIQPLFEFAPVTGSHSTTDLLKTLANMLVNGQLEGTLKTTAIRIIANIERTAQQIEDQNPPQAVAQPEPVQQAQPEPVQQAQPVPVQQAQPEPALAEALEDMSEDELELVQDFLERTRDASSAQVISKSAKQIKITPEQLLNIIKKANKAGQDTEFYNNKVAFATIANLAEALAKKVTGTLDAIKDGYDKQIADGEYNTNDKENPDEPPIRDQDAIKDPKEVSKDLVSLINELFAKVLAGSENIEERNSVLEEYTNFMTRCQRGVLQFDRLLRKKRGSVWSTLTDEDRKLVDRLGNILLAKPSATAGNWGPGELGLAILGNPVHKGGKGDLDVGGGRKIELKASQNAKKGGRFGTRALEKGLQGKKVYTEALQQLLKSAGYTDLNWSLKKENAPENNVGVYTKTNVKGKQSQGYIKFTSFGSTFVNENLNPRITGRVEAQDVYEFLDTVALSCLNKSEEFLPYYNTEEWIPHCINYTDNTIIYDVFCIEYAKMLYRIYQATDDVREILVINPLTGSYYVLAGPDDLDNAVIPDENLDPKKRFQHVQFGDICIDFTDSQGKASPQIGIA